MRAKWIVGVLALSLCLAVTPAQKKKKSKKGADSSDSTAQPADASKTNDATKKAETPTPPPPPTPAQQLTTLLTANGLKADVSFLASDLLEGRATPSKGLDLAAEYIAAQFRRAGLEPVGDDQYFQTAQFATVTPNTDGLALTIAIGGDSVKAAAGSVTIQDAAAAELSDAPYIRVPIDDPAALSKLTAEQVNGKVLLVDAASAASGAGGRGRGGVNLGPLRNPKFKPLAIVILQAPPAPAAGRGGRGGGGGGARPRELSTVAAYPTVACNDPGIRIAAQPAGKISLHVAEPKVEPAKVRNVVGLLRGSDPELKDTYLLVTGHYDHLGVRDNGTPDHIYNGADDDASGTSSVIEIANALSALPRPKRSILFMTVFGEELGDLGSHYYAAHPLFALAKTVVDLNLEQLGRTDDTEGQRVGAFNMTGYDYTDLPAIFEKVGKDTGIKAEKHPQNSDSYFRRSDNAAFADAGVPSTTISVAYDFPDYHQAGDEWPKLDYENMAKVDRTIALALLEVANNPEAPKWDESNPKTAAFVAARKATMAAAAGK